MTLTAEERERIKAAMVEGLRKKREREIRRAAPASEPAKPVKIRRVRKETPK